MASKNFKGRIKHTRDTSANWEAKNPVLLAGEVILVDTAAGELRSKTGDGSERYSQLPFDDEVIRNLINDSKYTHPSHNVASSGLYKITVDALGHVTAVTAVTKADITGLGIPGQDTNTTYSPATTSANGLMSKEDKGKLDGIASGANKYTHPAYTAKTSGLYKVTVDATGHVSAVAAVTKDDIVALGIPAQDTNTTYSVATTSADGLMAKGDKTKLNGIAAGAEVNVQSDWSVTDTGSDAFIKNKPDLSVYAKKSEYLPLTGGTLTGNLIVGPAKVQSNGYVVGTWLQATAANALTTKPPRICVQDNSGWIYSRTPDQILGDIGATKVQLVTWEATD